MIHLPVETSGRYSAYGRAQPLFLPAARRSGRLAEILKGVDQLHVIAFNAQLAVARAGKEGQAFGLSPAGWSSPSRDWRWGRRCRNRHLGLVCGGTEG
ncbi:MAG: hypothetical protein V5A19_03935 [Thiohalorhabdus sp.]